MLYYNILLQYYLSLSMLLVVFQLRIPGNVPKGCLITYVSSSGAKWANNCWRQTVNSTNESIDPSATGEEAIYGFPLKIVVMVLN